MTLVKIEFMQHFNKDPIEIEVDSDGKFALAVALSDLICADVDLRGANLSNANLTGADLSNANFSGAYFNGADFTTANLTDSNFSNACFIHATFNGTRVTRADFSSADFRLTKFGSIDFSETNLIPLPFANGFPGWAWKPADKKVSFGEIMISYGCHCGPRSMTLADAGKYWRGKENRQEIFAALCYAETVAELRGWID